MDQRQTLTFYYWRTKNDSICWHCSISFSADGWSDYYYEMPSINNGKLEINAVIDSSETKGIIFVSNDDGKSWKPRIDE